jgi:two-component system, cell cycle sensor histidine kinase and response regulator CckA
VEALAVELIVVDDEPAVLALTARILATTGARIHAFARAGAALDALDRMGGTDLVLTDITMPGGMDGQALAAEIGRRWPEIPIVLMSGDPASLERSPGRPLVREVLSKPFTAGALLETVRRVLALDSTTEAASQGLPPQALLERSAGRR